MAQILGRARTIEPRAQLLDELALGLGQALIVHTDGQQALFAPAVTLHLIG